MERLGPVLLGVVALAATAGCLSLDPAQLPAQLVQGSGGNGWQFNETASDAEPRSRSFGLLRFQALSYEDPGDQGGYPARLSLTTLRTVLSPSEEDLRDQARDRIQARADASGIRLEDAPERGSRTLESGFDTLYFVYDGNVSQDSGGFFTRDAPVKILGEVWTCSSSRTSVAVVGLAQITDVRYVGGNAVVEEPDDRNWQEIVADPSGSIEGVTGENGLVYNTQC